MFKTPEDRLSEIELYELVAEEIERNQQSKGLWAKAIADTEGDFEKAKALYIKLRVQMIKDEWAEEARQVILRRQKRRDEVCPDSPYVFFHEVKRGDVEVGGRVQDLKNSFKAACKQAGIEDFRIHDLRHTFASWLVMDGVPLFEVSRLLRHSGIGMTEKYAHLAPDHLHQAVAGRGFSAHFQHTENSLKAVA